MSASDTLQLERRNHELSILNAITEALNRSVDLTATLRTTLLHVTDLLDLHTGWIWLLNEENGQSYLAASLNLPPALAHNPGRMEGSCYCLDSYQAGDLDGAANVNVITCSRLQKLVDGTGGLRYHASVPLYAHGKQLGVLNVASREWRELAPEDLRLLYTVGDLLSIAVERARLFARSAELGALEERNRLAREIHDTLAQGLSAITLQLEAADANLDRGADSRKVRSGIRQALALARTNLEEARRSVLDLRAAPLEGRTLAEALAALTAECGERGNLLVHLDAVGGGHPLPVAVEVGIYRVIQEALANIVQHAGAVHATVRLVTTPDQVQVIVEDDGAGFDADAIPPNRFGLTGLNERVKLLSGTMRLQSSLGAGTKLEVAIPLPHKG